MKEFYCGAGQAIDLMADLHEVGQRALEISADRYSSGWPNYQGGTELKLGHNNARHNRMMGYNAARLLGHLGFGELDQTVGRIIGEAHDIQQLKGRGEDERISAEWLEREFRNVNVDVDVARRSARVILGTLPLFDADGNLVNQTINMMEFESAADEEFSKAVVSADLSELYTPFQPLICVGLYMQKHRLDVDQTPPLTELRDFMAANLRLLTNYTYPHQQAEAVFATHKYEALRYASFIFDQANNDRIEDWEHVRSAAQYFWRQPDLPPSRLWDLARNQ
ncbi:MAG TPA: hypothetical protein VF733_01215 [Candidatus Saccharimonadales bacterium]